MHCVSTATRAPDSLCDVPVRSLTFRSYDDAFDHQASDVYLQVSFTGPNLVRHVHWLGVQSSFGAQQ